MLKPLIARVKSRRGDAGFTLIELVVSATIIAAVLTTFTVFMLSVANTQRTASMTRTAERILASQVEATSAIKWDDLMLTPTSNYVLCDLPNDALVKQDRVSTQAVAAGPELVTTPDGLKVSITRNVQWVTDGTQVICSNTSNAKDRGEMKKVTVTVTWADGTETRTRSATIFRSRWAELPTVSSVPQPYGSFLTQVSTSTKTPWNVSYTRQQGDTPETGALDSNVTVFNSNEIKAIFYDTGTRTVGATVTGLTAGKTYIAVMKVMVPNNAGSVPVNLDVVGVRRSGLALANGTYYILSNTWQETGTSRVVGVSPDPSYSRSAAEAYIVSLTIYQQN